MQTITHIELSREEVADKARRLWRAEGCPRGRDLEYWLRAEVELLRTTYAALSGNTHSGAELPLGNRDAASPDRRALDAASPGLRPNGSRRAKMGIGSGAGKRQGRFQEDAVWDLTCQVAGN